MTTCNTQEAQRADGSGKLSLVRKLAEVMAEVERVPKSGRNDFHKYDYATEADIVAAVRKEMAQRSLMLVPTVLRTEWTEIERRNAGKDRLCTLTVRFTVHDGDSGEEMSFEVLGEGQDAGDKATYKAMTGAVKYALLKLFLIPTGDDPERDGDEAPRGSRQPTKQHTAPARSEPPRPAQSAPPAKPSAPVETPKAAEKPGPGPQVPGVQVVAFGPHKGVAVAKLTDAQLSESIDLAHEKLLAEPKARWAKAMRENVAMLEAEVELRCRVPAKGPALVAFGELAGEPIADLSDEQLAACIEEGITLVGGAARDDEGARKVRGNLEMMKGEKQRRAIVAQDARLAGSAP